MKKHKHQWKWESCDPDGSPDLYRCNICGEERESDVFPNDILFPCLFEHIEAKRKRLKKSSFKRIK